MDEFVDDTEEDTKPRGFEGEVEATSSGQNTYSTRRST